MDLVVHAVVGPDGATVKVSGQNGIGVWVSEELVTRMVISSENGQRAETCTNEHV